MEKISWCDGITNEVVLGRVGETQKLMGLIRSRKREWIGHVMRGEGILKEVIKGRMEGRRTTGRPLKGTLDELIATSYVDMNRRTENRGGIEKDAVDLPKARSLRYIYIPVVNLYTSDCDDLIVSTPENYDMKRIPDSSTASMDLQTLQ